MNIQQISFSLDDPGKSQVVSISGTSAQSAVINAEHVIVTPTTDCFVRQGANPTATSDGTDLFLLGLSTYRLDIPRGAKLAFKTTGATGSVYITPGG